MAGLGLLELSAISNSLVLFHQCPHCSRCHRCRCLTLLVLSVSSLLSLELRSHLPLYCCILLAKTKVCFYFFTAGCLIYISSCSVLRFVFATLCKGSGADFHYTVWVNCLNVSQTKVGLLFVPDYLVTGPAVLLPAMQRSQTVANGGGLSVSARTPKVWISSANIKVPGHSSPLQHLFPLALGAHHPHLASTSPNKPRSASPTASSFFMRMSSSALSLPELKWEPSALCAGPV